MAIHKGFGRCFKCNHKCLNRCKDCGDHICFFHSVALDESKRQCYRCQAKYYILDQEEALEKAESDAAFEVSTQPKCEQCGEFAIVLCDYCCKTVCSDHRVQKTDSKFVCLDCHYLLQEI